MILTRVDVARTAFDDPKKKQVRCVMDGRFSIQCLQAWALVVGRIALFTQAPRHAEAPHFTCRIRITAHEHRQ